MYSQLAVSFQRILNDTEDIGIFSQMALERTVVANTHGCMQAGCLQMWPQFSLNQ